MWKKVWIVFLVLFVMVLAGGCKYDEPKDKEPPLTLTAENVEEWFEEHREYFEAVKEQVLLCETDFQSFRFHKKSWISSKLIGNYSGKDKTLKKGPLKDALKAFFKATRPVEANYILVTRGSDVDDMRFYCVIDRTHTSGGGMVGGTSTHVNFVYYVDETGGPASGGLGFDWKELGDGWFYQTYKLIAN